ncbi:hypothetical protein H7J88_02490 [Mycolicibacterium flavescens]|uniref:Secreted protein n=1 Tax=Mycolicibacterium flavescens TaxID=1776 RepID=A0A1E3RC22_MYCFV|nr:hypothetical protein [Mycolicibacterium flavescens]MCV7278513.1 hypothetical protein [Mycolicibacterium flavescens]ODQ87450.1 hypothetical protein BHQ18_23980 [Mycolicibacterium flavescens]
MKVTLGTIAMLLGSSAAAAAIITAPAAAAATVPNSNDAGRNTTTQRPGHVAIQVFPPAVTPPRIWGPSSSPMFLLGD